MKKSFITIISSLLITTNSFALVVHDPIMTGLMEAEWAKELAEMGKQYKMLTDTFSINKGIMYETSASTQKQIVSDRIRKELPGSLGNTIADMTNGCLDDFGGNFGLDIKLPDLNICGVNLVGRVSEQIENELAEALKDQTLPTTNVPAVNTKNKPTEEDIEETLKDIGAIADNKDNGEKDLDEGTDDGSGSNGKTNKRGPVNKSPSSKLSKLLNETKKQPDYVEGLPYTPSQKAFANSLYNQQLKNEILKDIDRKKQSNNQKAVTDMLNEDLKKQVEAHPNNNALTNVPVILPKVKRSASYVRTDDGDHVLLASGNYNKNLFVTEYSLNTGDQLIKEDMKPLKDFEKDYKKFTGNALNISKGEQFNYARMAELNFRSTLFSVSSMNMSSDKGAQLIQAEYLKGILTQLFILNTQLTVMYDKQARNDTIRYKKIEDKLDSYGVLLEKLLQQNKEYRKINASAE